MVPWEGGGGVGNKKDGFVYVFYILGCVVGIIIVLLL